MRLNVMTKQTTAMPRYGLSKALVEAVPSPPVMQAGGWSKAYPSPSSPFLARNDDKDCQNPKGNVPPFVNVAQGMPSHLPSAKMREKMAQEAAKDAHHSYSQPSSELLHALATTMNGVYRKESAKGSPSAIQTSDICLTAGCNMASEFVFRAVADVGVNDGIVLPTPFVRMQKLFAPHCIALSLTKFTR